MIFESSYLLPPTISLIKFTLKLNQNRIRNTRVNSHFYVTDWLFDTWFNQVRGYQSKAHSYNRCIIYGLVFQKTEHEVSIFSVTLFPVFRYRINHQPMQTATLVSFYLNQFMYDMKQSHIGTLECLIEGRLE